MPDIQVVDDAGVTVTRDADGTATIDQFGEIGVEVDGTRVTIGQEGTLSSDGTTTSASGDSGVSVDSGGEHVGAGVTAGLTNVEGDDRSDRGLDLGVFAERGDDRVEAGGFASGERDDSGLIGQTVGTEVGGYVSRNDEEVRAGYADHSNSETFDTPPSKGVFVQDTDGERHDAHTTLTYGTTTSFSGGQVEVDPGPVSVTGRVGLDEDYSPVVGAEIDSEFGSFDDFLPDELLDEPGASSDRPSEPVAVHDELGNPIDNAEEPMTSDEATTLGLDGATDTSMFSDVADSIGAVGADAVEAVQDFFDDLIGRGDE